LKRREKTYQVLMRTELTHDREERDNGKPKSLMIVLGRKIRTRLDLVMIVTKLTTSREGRSEPKQP
jgi:hypothetical protein